MLKPPSILPFVAALLFTFGIAENSQASEDYQCTIERYSRAEGDSGPSYKMVQDAFVGKQFTVDRSSGITVGALKNSVDSKPQVVDRGSDYNSFKVFSAAGSDEFHPGSIVSALNVMEFVTGEIKPFNFMVDDGVFFGTCKHF